MTTARIQGIFTGRAAQLGSGGVLSAFVKKRAGGPVEAGIAGFSGDEQADLRVHGGPDMAIYAYNRSHYVAWMSEFPEHAGLWGEGALGENLSMDGWDETNVCAGDVVHLGSALLQVTRPRKPCFKLALRFNDLRLPRRLVETGRCGWYYRVLRSGAISEGDEAVLVSRLHPEWSIRRINDLSIQVDADPVELRELAELPELAGNWRAQVQAVALASEAGARKSAFRTFNVIRVLDESVSIRSFELAPADGEGIATAVPGQHLVVRGDVGGLKTSRPYSISAVANTHLQISVKREIGGFSEWLHKSITAGDRLDVLGPRGSFKLDMASDLPLVLISGGVGITPMMAMLQAATTNNGARIVPASVAFIHCTRDSSQQAFKAQLSDIAARHPAVAFHTRFSRPLSADRIGKTHDSVGRIDRDLVQQTVAPLGASNVYVCGPDAFMADVRGWIEELKSPGIRVMTEVFGPSGGTTPVAERKTRPSRSRVNFMRSGRVLKMTDVGSLLDLAEAEGVAVESDCRSGICGACVAKVISGQVAYDAEPIASVAEGEVLLCCGFPLAEELVLDL
ncbi:MOSC domain-containing protein [Tardiphaga sp. 866_E4_N2_1]|uniref:MOSC domain-containing protein n=1 Tax=Tardiphaga sp. 866_E4_N2_1 TaxID=3240767 RepID=UPI003F24F333